MHVCYNDTDCEEGKLCKKLKVQWDDTLENWGIYNFCGTDDGMMEKCDLIGDHTKIYDDSSIYSVSVNCE